MCALKKSDERIRLMCETFSVFRANANFSTFFTIMSGVRFGVPAQPWTKSKKDFHFIWIRGSQIDTLFCHRFFSVSVFYCRSCDFELSYFARPKLNYRLTASPTPARIIRLISTKLWDFLVDSPLRRIAIPTKGTIFSYLCFASFYPHNLQNVLHNFSASIVWGCFESKPSADDDTTAMRGWWSKRRDGEDEEEDGVEKCVLEKRQHTHRGPENRWTNSWCFVAYQASPTLTSFSTKSKAKEIKWESFG